AHTHTHLFVLLQYAVRRVRCLCCVQDFEVRRYAASEWITISVENKDFVAANSRLKNAGYEFHSDAWPVLINQTEAENGLHWFLSWFVPPDTTKPESPDPSVTLHTKPEATVYVKVFKGTPSPESGLKNAKLLQNDLEKANKTFDSSTFVGAGYEPYLSWDHHNEIWIYAT
uniref:Heme-binding protein soul5 n=1 Tax=Acanthochromis polyacanthus TaxID=80966 RepID=A0A3Q1GYB5_9TELE